MENEFGNFLGWCIVVCYVGTILNFILKFIIKKYGKTLMADPKRKKIIEVLMSIFLKKHKLWGFATVLLLLVHFTLQFLSFGLNPTGGIAALLLILQVLLGMFGSYTHKKRKGLWFILHRTIACLLILAIAIHVLVPGLIKLGTTSSSAVSETVSATVFTLDELATYNGQNGQPAYIAYDGVVYDVSNVAAWRNGEHNGNKAGTDITKAIAGAPHGVDVIGELTAVGVLEGN